MKTLIFNKITIGILLGFLLSTTIAFGYRMPKPPKIVDTKPQSLNQLNETLEELWNISNGRFSPNSGAVASTGVGSVKMGSVNNANSTGFLKFEKSDGTIVYVPYFSTDTP